jgi:hypothetical protein
MVEVMSNTSTNKRTRKTDEPTAKPARPARSRRAEKPAEIAPVVTPAPEPVKPSPSSAATGVKPFAKEPKAEVRAVRQGTKIAAIIDLISRKQGATLTELQELLSPKSPIRTVLNWDMHHLVGYGYVVGIDGIVHIALPKGLKAPLPHIVK